MCEISPLWHILICHPGLQATLHNVSLVHHVCIILLQLAVTMRRLIELADGMDKPHIICGDFNAWPGAAPYQLIANGHLDDNSFTDLQAILTIDSGDSQVTELFIIFCIFI